MQRRATVVCVTAASSRRAACLVFHLVESNSFDGSVVAANQFEIVSKIHARLTCCFGPSEADGRRQHNLFTAQSPTQKNETELVQIFGAAKQRFCFCFSFFYLFFLVLLFFRIFVLLRQEAPVSFVTHLDHDVIYSK